MGIFDELNVRLPGTGRGRPTGLRADAEAYASSLGLTPGGPGWGDAIRDYVLNGPRQVEDAEPMPFPSLDGDRDAGYRSGPPKKRGVAQRRIGSPPRPLSRGERKAIHVFLGGRDEDFGRDPSLEDRYRMPSILAPSPDEIDEPSIDEEYQALLIVEDGLNPDGSFKVSPAGAVGPAQILPSTGPEAAKLAGRRWDLDLFWNNREYNEALGKAYYQNLRRKYDAVTAAAAYNWRPSYMDFVVSDSARTGTPLEEYLPLEPRRHVRKFRRYLGLPDPDVPEKEWKAPKKAWRPPGS